MRHVYITFSGAPYDATTQLIVSRAPLLGADDVVVYDDQWLLDEPFCAQNRWLWDHPHKRGFGWYAWKPYVIMHALAQCPDGDVVLYTDADCVPIAPLGVLYDQCVADGGIMLFAAEAHMHVRWCKRDCFITMGQDEARYHDARAGVARFMLFQKGPWRTTQFLAEWLTYCVNPRANTFDPSVHGPELPPFVEHRAEQAILTNLAHKYGLELYREACQAGNGSHRHQDLYGQLFEQINPHEEKVTAPAAGSAHFNVGLREVAR